MRGRPISRYKLAQVWLRRLAFVFLIVLSVALLGLTRVEAPWAIALRTGLMDALAPIAHGLSLPAQAVSGWFSSVRDATRISEENAALRREVDQLRLRLQAMDQTERDNREFRSLLGVKLAEDGRHIAARVIADPGGPYVRSLL